MTVKTEIQGRHTVAEIAHRPSRPPVRYWAIAGAVILAFICWVMIRWIVSPDFKSVPTGPTPVPGFMKVAMIAFQVLTPVAALAIFYRALVRPWRRERRITTDGLLVICYLTMWFQDPLSAYTGNYFNNNAYLFNRGSWVNQIPGWMPQTKPGTGIVESPLFTAGTYVWMMFVAAAGCCALMRWLKARRPTISTATLIASSWLVMFLFDLVFEGLVFMPLGIFQYGGAWASFSLFPSTYHKFPIGEAIFFGALMTAIASLRYFKNDRGETIVERGITQLKAGTRTKLLLRFLALLAGCQLIFLLVLNVPVALFMATHPGPFPADLQRRSYLMGGLCGDGTDRACPGPGIPLPHGLDTIHLSPDGQLVVPPGSTLPTLIPSSTSGRSPS
jgi:Spirocyclase AveC-like